MPAPAPTGTTSSRPPASASRAPKAWASRASTPSPAASSRPIPTQPLQADAAGLRGSVTDRLAAAFQVERGNPLVGLDGRATLLRRLGEALREQPEVFGDDGRPGGLFDALVGPYGPARRRPPRSRRTRSCSLLHDAARHLAGRQHDRQHRGRRQRRRRHRSATRRCRSATAGATARCPAPASPTAGCRSTSSRSGSPTRCSSPSNGPASRCAASTR